MLLTTLDALKEKYQIFGSEDSSSQCKCPARHPNS